MNNQGEHKEDMLKQYMNHDGSETAPKGFTSKVMARIQLEAKPTVISAKSRTRSLVPLVSVIIIILLLVTALLIPGSEPDSITLPVLTLFQNIRSILPTVNFSSVFGLTLPSVIMYIFIGILFLALFDRALYGIFHREK